MTVGPHNGNRTYFATVILFRSRLLSRDTNLGWMGLAQDRDRWRTLVSAVMNLLVP